MDGQPVDGFGHLVEVHGRYGQAHPVRAAEDLGVARTGPPVGEHQAVGGHSVHRPHQRSEVAGNLEPVGDQHQRVFAEFTSVRCQLGIRTIETSPSGLSRSVIRASAFSEIRYEVSARSTVLLARSRASSE